MPLRCNAARCDGLLKDVVETRDGAYEGRAASRVFLQAQALEKGDGFIFRRRVCPVCGKHTSTIERIAIDIEPHMAQSGLRKVPSNGASAPFISPTTKLKPSDARVAGYTGEPCEQCCSMRTTRNGTCLLCLDCNYTGSCGG